MTFKTISKKVTSKKVKNALVLGGGGSHGFAHVGVLEVLEEKGYVPDLIVGCSMGALIGVGYAAGKTHTQIKKYLLSRNLYLLFRPSIPRGLLSNEKIVDSVLKFAQVTTFEELFIPMKINATNINSGRQFVFDSGDLKSALMATCAVPGVFAPVEYNKELYIDGGFSSPLPLDLAKDAKRIIAVDTFSQLKHIPRTKQSIPAIFQNASIIPQRKVVRGLVEEYEQKVTVISPYVGNFDFFDLSHKDIKRIVLLGVEAAYRALGKPL